MTREKSSKAKFIEIIAAPRGQAPEEVRKAWIGCILPLAEDSNEKDAQISIGVLGPKLEAYRGFTVPAAAAFEVLKRRSAEAETWWRNNCSYLFAGGQKLIFNADACKPVEPN